MNSFLAALVNGAIAGGVFTAIVWVVMAFLPRRLLNAATRYVIWWATLAVVIFLPMMYLPVAPAPVADTALPVIEEVTTTVESAPVVAKSSEPVEAASTSRWPRFPLEIAAGRWPVWILSA